MRGIRDFVIYTDVVYNDTFKTESGLELFGDKRFLQKRLSQKEVVIKSCPFEYKGEDVTGWQAIIDPTIYFKNIFDHGEGQNNEVEGHKGHFTVQHNMILAVRKDETEEWQGFEKNILVKKVMDDSKEKVTSSGIITELSGKKEKQGYATVDIPNCGLKTGDTVIYHDYYGVDVFLESSELLWIREKDVLVKVLEDEQV